MGKEYVEEGCQAGGKEEGIVCSSHGDDPSGHLPYHGSAVRLRSPPTAGDVECQATFKNHCQYPKCDCDLIQKFNNGNGAQLCPNTDRIVKYGFQDTEDLEGKCHALWLLSGKETEEWNGESCDCPFIHGSVSCKLNPF